MGSAARGAGHFEVGRSWGSVAPTMARWEPPWTWVNPSDGSLPVVADEEALRTFNSQHIKGGMPKVIASVHGLHLPDLRKLVSGRATSRQGPKPSTRSTGRSSRAPAISSAKAPMSWS
jgi:hypothetical protein